MYKILDFLVRPKFNWIGLLTIITASMAIEEHGLTGYAIILTIGIILDVTLTRIWEKRRVD